MKTLLMALAAALTLAACGGAPATQRIDDAELNLSNGRLDAARRSADGIVAGADTASLSASELCRLAMVYAAVGDDSIGNEADIAMAARCIRRALAKDSAAVDSFIHAMPVDKRPLMALAIQLCRGTHAGDVIDYEDESALEPDSLQHQP